MCQTHTTLELQHSTLCLLFHFCQEKPRYKYTIYVFLIYIYVCDFLFIQYIIPVSQRSYNFFTLGVSTVLCYQYVKFKALTSIYIQDIYTILICKELYTRDAMQQNWPFMKYTKGYMLYKNPSLKHDSEKIPKL